MTDHTDPYPERVRALEAEGMTTSDAQAVADAESMGAKPMPRARRTPAEKVAEGKTRRNAQAIEKVTTKNRGPRECACGCGEMTKGGVYRPGHDARHHAALKASGKKLTLITPAAKRKKGTE